MFSLRFSGPCFCLPLGSAHLLTGLEDGGVSIFPCSLFTRGLASPCWFLPCCPVSSLSGTRASSIDTLILHGDNPEHRLHPPRRQGDHIQLWGEQTKTLKGSQKGKRETRSHTFQASLSIAPHKWDKLAALLVSCCSHRPGQTHQNACLSVPLSMG